MSSPVTLPTFEIHDGQVAVVKKGTTVIGQAMSINPQQQSGTSKHPRLGSTTQKTMFQPVTNTVALQLYTELTMEQLALLLGGDTMPGSGGWTAGKQLKLDPTIAPYDLKVEVYDTANPATAALQYTYFLISFKPNSLGINYQAGSVSMLTLNGDCDDAYITPATGIGA